MKGDFSRFIPQELKKLADYLPFPLYVVGGATRDFLAGYARKKEQFTDWDISAPVSHHVFIAFAEKFHFTLQSIYPTTGTAKLVDAEGVEYEFSCFRSDKYVRGKHRPDEVYFTQDINLDCQRRDFTCNAVYYDIKADKFVDPLGGIEDIKNKVMRTVRESDRVFGEDGLRLMRLARFCGGLGFTVAEETLRGAKQNAKLIADIVPERIYAELTAILIADSRYGVTDGHYRGLKVLDEIGVLDIILPELTLGRGMQQPEAYHNYDVLEHSLRSVLYAQKEVRLASLLHDIGKPKRMLEHGNFYDHQSVGATLADDILTRFKAPKSVKEATHALVQEHMYDLDLQTGEKKLRRYLVAHYPLLSALLAVKQADFSACKDDLSTAPTVKRWQTLLESMKKEGVPFTLKEMNVDGKDLLNAGIPPINVGKTLHKLLLHLAVCPQDNEKEKLLKIAKGVTVN